MDIGEKSHRQHLSLMPYWMDFSFNLLLVSSSYHSWSDIFLTFKSSG